MQMEKFTYESPDILDRLAEPTDILSCTYDDYLKLPVNELYEKNQKLKKEAEEAILSNKKETDDTIIYKKSDAKIKIPLNIDVEVDDLIRNLYI